MAEKIGKNDIENQRKSQLEHILLRPDTYIGSVEYTKDMMWVYEANMADPNAEQDAPRPTGGRMVQREISYVPGLYKIFDEILVNAADNKQRDKTMNTIKIDINAEENVISVFNNGKGIPVVMNKDENMFVPTMIFGHLLASSNYSGKRKRGQEEIVTGCRNGYGAKLCNIFSNKFVVETASRQHKKCFRQTWANNMSEAAEPKITEFKGVDYTKITFSPDLTKFKMDKLDDDIVALMSRRAYDVAASSRGVSVYLNGTKLLVKNFKDYIDLYLKDVDGYGAAPMKIVHEKVNERWEIAMTISERGFQQVSFVNSIATTKGGTHVDDVVDAVVNQLNETLKKKNKGGVTIKPCEVKNHLWIFVSCLIVNPTFDSKTKEKMTLQAKDFGSTCSFSDKFMANVLKSGIVKSVLTWAKFEAETDLAKTSGRKNQKPTGIPRLEDANEAGGKNSHLCTLILTKGDPAKAMITSGLDVVGRDLYGVFQLSNKLPNARETTFMQILDNEDIRNIIKILGLKLKKKYLLPEDLNKLRYGKVLLMTEMDMDGSHNKSLLINFIHTNWPELLRLSFLEQFITPIVKATKMNKSTKQEVELSFYSLPEFEEWLSATPDNNTYRIKYFKSLSSSTAKEAKDYFQNMERHRIIFKHDGSQDDESIKMAFSKKCIDQRKTWINNFLDESKRRKVMGHQEKYLYTKTTKEISYADFFNLEVVLYYIDDNIRSIPSMVDGFKRGERKVMFTCFKRNDKHEVNVAELTASVAEMSAYHHDEVSLSSTIINLAQNYVGSNNINLLVPAGQFGTRLLGGKDSGSPRYIFTQMSPLTRLIFNPLDDPLLEYQYDGNKKIEPTFYIPIIPMVLVNGADGIGTGYSTKIANHNPRELIRCLRKMIEGEEPDTLQPWYNNFTGTIQAADTRFLTKGNFENIGDNKIEITELPIGTWTQAYKNNVLEHLLHGSDEDKPLISDYKAYHTDTKVRFVISFAEAEFDKIRDEAGGFHRVFKLSSIISTNSMHAFDRYFSLRKFKKVNDILTEFYAVRLEFYVKRKAYWEGFLEAEADKLSNQARFILATCNRTLSVDEVINLGYRSDPVKEWKKKIAMEDEEEKADSAVAALEEEEASNSNLSDVQNYDYLLGIPDRMFTQEHGNELLKQLDVKLADLSSLKEKTPKNLWLDDLETLEKKIQEIEKLEREEEERSN